jgi:hypothetical protein
LRGSSPRHPRFVPMVERTNRKEPVMAPEIEWDCPVCETWDYQWDGDGCSCWWCASCKATNPHGELACKWCGVRHQDGVQ